MHRGCVIVTLSELEGDQQAGLALGEYGIMPVLWVLSILPLGTTSRPWPRPPKLRREICHKVTFVINRTNFKRSQSDGDDYKKKVTIFLSVLIRWGEGRQQEIPTDAAI